MTRLHAVLNWVEQKERLVCVCCLRSDELQLLNFFCANKFVLLLTVDIVFVNPLLTKRRPLYLKTQSVPRYKHFSLTL
jgi:hypothetical protein